MTSTIFIVGCGGFGREVFALVRALQVESASWEIGGFIDDSPSRENLSFVEELGARVVGDVNYLAHKLEEVYAVVAIGSPTLRRTIVNRLSSSPVLWPNLIHPSATIGPRVQLGQGTIVAAGARLSTNISLGNHVHVDQNATVGHDSILADYSRLNPQACISGSVHIHEGALVGAGAIILANLQLGAYSMVGAGAVVTHDVVSATTVKGIPAK